MTAPTTVAEALAVIPSHRAKLDAEDARLVETIRHVEHALNEMRPGVTTTFNYQLQTAPRRRTLEFTPANKRWIIVWVGEEVDVPLLSASRDVRAEVFSPVLEGLSPIERLIIEVADNLQVEGTSRSPMLEVARRLSATLTEAGYAPPSR